MLKLMALMQTYMQTCIKDEKGATSVEYILIVAGILLAVSALVWSYGGQFSELLNDESVVSGAATN